MIFKWNRRRPNFNSDNFKSEDFREHDQNIRRFYKAHHYAAMANPPRLYIFVPVMRAVPLLPSLARKEMGGIRRHPELKEWEALVPLWRVASYRLSQN